MLARSHELRTARDDFATKIDEGDNANDWLMIPWVDRLVAAGKLLEAGQCYSYVQLPIVGGDYSPENTRIVAIETHYAALGPIQEKLKDIPEGTQVDFHVGVPPKEDAG